MKYSSIKSKASDKVLLSTILCIKLCGRELSLYKHLSVSFKAVSYSVVTAVGTMILAAGQRDVSSRKKSGLC